MTSLWRHLWPNYNTLDFKILTQCVKLLGERVLQVWWWYLHWFRRYRKKTRGGARNSPPPVGRGLTFSLQKNQWLNFDSSSIQLTQLWLKWRPPRLHSDSTQNLDFHGRLNSDTTHLSQSRVKFDSRLPRPSTTLVTTHKNGNYSIFGRGLTSDPSVIAWTR